MRGSGSACGLLWEDICGKRLWEIVQATVRACRHSRLTHNANLLTENANLHD